MRDLLFLAHRIPYPPDKGDKIRSYHILCYLASRFRVHLGCFFDEAADARYVAALKDICADVLCLPLGRTQKAIRAVQAIARGCSISEASYTDPRMTKWVQDKLQRYDIEDVFLFCSTMAPYAQAGNSRRRIVTDIVDVDSEKWRAYARRARWPMSWLYNLEQRGVLDLEKRAAAASRHVLFVSHAEAQAFVRLAPELADRVGYLENGVDLDRFDPQRAYADPFDPQRLAIAFTGAMNYRPNVDAVEWFAREVFPAVRRACADAEFWIVGANPADAVRRLAREPGIHVTGAVADVRPYLAHARCAVAPLRIARGVQNKVLEAMAMAKPVILSPAALEGLGAIPGREVLVAADAAGFADSVMDVLGGRGPELGRAARARVESDHRWSENLKILDSLFPHGPVDESCHAAEMNSWPLLVGAAS